MVIPDSKKQRISSSGHGSNTAFSAYSRGWASLVLLAGLVIGGGLLYQHFSHKQAIAGEEKKDKKKPATVTAAAVKAQDMPIYLDAIGNVTPRNIVQIRSRIDGQLNRVLFKEGQYVKQGDLLAEIDPRTYQVQLAQAQGQLAKDQALLKNAQLDLERYKKLLAQDSAPEQQVATQASLVSQYQGAIQTDQSQIDSAKLQLSYTRITAPISGRVGLRQVDAGNIVHQGDANGMLSIAQVKPITVVFSIPQDRLAGVLSAFHKGDKLPVEVFGREQKNALAKGELVSVDNQIDTTTGTVKLKAEFANDDESLFPNQFVNVRVLLGTKLDALVVPNSAVQGGTQGTFVYQVLPDHQIKMKPINITVADEEESAIEGDVHLGDLVVTSGADKLRDGAKVNLAKTKGGRGEHGKKGDDVSADKQANAPAEKPSNPSGEASDASGKSQHRHHPRSAE